MTIYRYIGGLPLKNYVKRAEGVTIQYDGPITVNGVQAHLIAGVRAVDAPVWGKHVNQITGVELALSGTTPFAVILIPVGDWVMAVTFGSGRYLLDGLWMDEGFGLLFAIRRLDPTKLRTVSSSLLDISARSSQVSFPLGSTVPGFGLDPAGELVTRIAGKADMDGLTYHEATDGKQYQIRAGDSLAIQIGNSPETFLADLEAICAVTAESDQNSPLRALAQIRPLGENDPLRPKLEGRLAVALGGDDQFGPLGLCWPTPAAKAMDEANSFYTNDVGGYGPIEVDADLDITAITERFARIPVSARVSELEISRLMPCADEHGQELLTHPISMSRWIAFETTIDNRTFCLYQGQWYELGQESVDRVREQVAELLTNKSGLTFPLWTPTGKQDDEHRYCEQVARQDGYLCLDKSFARTPMHPKFELADVIGPNNEIIHIKWLAKATAASHLFTQAQVSAWSQRYEAEALVQLDAKVHLLDTTRRITTRPRVVVLAIAGRQWDVKQLFTLSMVSLLHLNEDLHHLGITLQFADIPYVAKSKRRSKPAAHPDGRAA
ncbi:TIGR04141 family sporadically distributed protein [Actinosynnema sp. NPDC051121]